MDDAALTSLLERSKGRFVCSGISDPGATKVVEFEHVREPGASPEAMQLLEEIAGDMPELLSFYRICNELRLYWDRDSNESAYLVASIVRWPHLKEGMDGWLEILDDEDKEDLPDWLEDSLVFVEIPRTGDYMLLSCSGETKGQVFRFYHDGFEFVPFAPSIEAMLEKMLDLDENDLTDIATHLRFMDVADPMIQWWIDRYERSDGKTVETDA